MVLHVKSVTIPWESERLLAKLKTFATGMGDPPSKEDALSMVNEHERVCRAAVEIQEQANREILALQSTIMDLHQIIDGAARRTIYSNFPEKQPQHIANRLLDVFRAITACGHEDVFEAIKEAAGADVVGSGNFEEDEI